jgi:hypothetical protein
MLGMFNRLQVQANQLVTLGSLLAKQFSSEQVVAFIDVDKSTIVRIVLRSMVDKAWQMYAALDIMLEELGIEGVVNNYDNPLAVVSAVPTQGPAPCLNISRGTPATSEQCCTGLGTWHHGWTVLNCYVSWSCDTPLALVTVR